MVNPLIFIHAIIAEIGLFAFLWVLVELLNPTETRIRRAKIAALIGVICLLTAWLAGGFYYVEVYGSHIKPVIKASEAKWVHSIVMEVKEHMFLFLPILAMLTVALLHKFDMELIKRKDAQVTIILLAGLVFLLGFSIVGMGAVIASGYRFALESGLI
jgi:predicted neutral ceramidase superfamily lipid hydrolase